MAQLGFKDRIGAGVVCKPNSSMRSYRGCGDLRNALFFDKLGYQIQSLLCPLAYTILTLHTKVLMTVARVDRQHGI